MHIFLCIHLYIYILLFIYSYLYTQAFPEKNNLHDELTQV